MSPVLSQMNAVFNIPSYFFEIYFNIILLLVPRCSKWSVVFRFPHQNSYMHFSCFHMCHILHKSLICLVTLIMLAISANREASNAVFFSLLILPFRPTYLPQHPIFEHSQVSDDILSVLDRWEGSQKHNSYLI